MRALSRWQGQPGPCGPAAAPRGRRVVRSGPCVVARNNWRTFGPSVEFSDGDAEYYQLTSRLSKEYDWFAPGQADQGEERQAEQPEPEQPSTSREDGHFGLSERQIRALGLAGPRSDLPDPVSLRTEFRVWVGAPCQACNGAQLCSNVAPHPGLCRPSLAQKTLSSRNYLRGEKFQPDQLGFNAVNMAGGAYRPGRGYTGARAAYGDYTKYPEGRPLFLPEAERFGNPPDLPSLLLQQRVIYISMPVRPAVASCTGDRCGPSHSK
jgi:ATP-dependent Clp protease protease subunit